MSDYAEFDGEQIYDMVRRGREEGPPVDEEDEEEGADA